MAMLISRATGNFTSSSTWGVADSATGSQNFSYFSTTNTTTSYAYSSTFTGTNTRVSDGIVLFLKRLNTTGTVTVALSDDNGVTATREVTVNASDLPADESWVFFKFGTTLTLDGGNDYRIGVKSSSAGNAMFYNSITANNWLRIVSTTLTAAPAATDTFLIIGELTGAGASSSYTVTMDNTATTDFGTNTSSGVLPTQTAPDTFNGMQVCQNGTLIWGTSAATNYYLRLSGHLVVYSGGTYNMGTSGTPCPRDSTMTLQLDSTASLVYALCAAAGSTVNVYGQSRTSGKNIVQCKLSADAAVNATSLSIDTDTGWLDNDEIVIAATTTDRTQCEIGALNGAAGASTLTVDGFAGTAGGLAFAHSGTSPTQAEIINLSRNVVIRGNSTSQPAVVRSFVNATAFNIYWGRFSWTGSSAGSNQSAATVSDIQYCAFFEYGSLGNVFRGATFSNNVSFSPTTTGTVLTLDGTVAPTVTNNTIMRGGSGIIFSGTGTVPGGTFSGNSIVGAQISGLAFGITSQAQDINISNFVIHSCNTTGMNISSQSPTDKNFTATNIKVWRNATNGISVAGIGVAFIDNADIFGNAGTGIVVSGSAANIKFSNSRISSDATVTTPVGFSISSAIQVSASFENCKFSEVTGIYTANTVDISVTNNATIFTRPMITLNNVLLGAATEVSNPANLNVTGFIKSSKHDQTEGAFKSWFQGGIVERDTTIFNTATPSERLTPSSASIKLASGPRLVAVDDGSTITINAYVRKSVVGDGAAYNGNQPRLIVRANPACGITTDTVLDTMTAAAGSWEQLTGTTAAVDADGALEFIVDCDGTVGWVNVDDWSAT
jgi:hypothetical protein